MDSCIQCGRTADELGRHLVSGFATLFIRPRPTHLSEYAVCLDCARRIRREQDERAQEAIREAERSGV